ncbi:STAS domain-containing protein [Streptomyces sp. NPDC020898]|uniref:STAS domain-containing protein n=1 Tax=Streptomyces sp. NPDC020898 TaxID=3365101 RepID=UPI00379C8EE0
MNLPGPFSATACVQHVRPYGACTLVVLGGEIDLYTGPAITHRLDALTSTRDIELLVDLRPVEFMDVAGVRVLTRARTRSRSGRLQLICTRPALLHLLHHPVLRLDFTILSTLPTPHGLLVLPHEAHAPRAPARRARGTGPSAWL